MPQVVSAGVAVNHVQRLFDKQDFKQALKEARVGHRFTRAGGKPLETRSRVKIPSWPVAPFTQFCLTRLHGQPAQRNVISF